MGRKSKCIKFEFYKKVGWKQLVNLNSIYWNVEKVDENIVLITLKENITVANKIVLHLYRKLYGRNIQIPITSLRARFYLDSYTLHSECNLNQVIDEYRCYDATEIDFDQLVINHPYYGIIIDCDFTKGVMFSCKNDKEKIKLLNLLEKAYATFLQGKLHRKLF
ncbi:hypothetical protein FOA24_19200 [Bacillus thuringiensis]|uniref:hypothetical protein n=1 Tax=Bacillus thuringiensis TaxID=1428 RepID=UPI00333BD992